MRLRFIGDRTPVRRRTSQADLRDAERTTAGNTRLQPDRRAVLWRARRDRRRRAARWRRRRWPARLDPAKLDEDGVQRLLSTAGIPDPDLILRTSGEQRLSNFLLWQAAYAEFVFLDVLWPDFGHAHFAEALAEYARRERRFGARPG